MNTKNLELFWYWIRERELIRELKEKGCQPEWTQDPILQTYHFCNVRREDDRGTKEIHAAVQESGISEWNYPWAYTMARMFNKAGTVRLALSAFAHGGTKHDMAEVVKASREIGNKIFHTAYVVSTCGKSMDKVDYVMDVIGKVRGLDVPRVGLAHAHSILMGVDGLGSFLAAQVVADLRNGPYLKPITPTEGTYWSSHGPGSLKGLNYIFGGATPVVYPALIMNLYEVMPPDIGAMGIHAQDLQNCLCEFSKYMRHLNGENGRKRYYDH